MKKHVLEIDIDAPQEDWDAFLAEIEKTEMRLAELEVEARRIGGQVEESVLRPWLQRLRESLE